MISKSDLKLIKISDLGDTALAPYVSKSEAELLHYYEPKEGIFIAETANVIIRALDAGYRPESILAEEERMEIEAFPVFKKIREINGDDYLNNLPVYITTHETLSKITGYNLIRGLCAVMRRKPLKKVEDFLKDKKRVVILYDVVNPTNSGAIIRSAAALGMDGVILTSNCVNPLVRRASRVSMGTVFQVPWTVASAEEIDKELKEKNYTTLAMALTENSIAPDSEELKGKEKIAVYLGTEGEGLPKNVIESSDYRIMIPMMHGVDSLNVASAAAVICWELAKKK